MLDVEGSTNRTPITKNLVKNFAKILTWIIFYVKTFSDFLLIDLCIIKPEKILNSAQLEKILNLEFILKSV